MTKYKYTHELLDCLHSSGKLNYDDYSLLRDAIDSLETQYDSVKAKLVFALDKFRTERNELEKSFMYYNIAIGDVENLLGRCD